MRGYAEVYAVVGTRKNKEARFAEENGSGYKQKANAKFIYLYLKEQGWSKEAICAVLGNMQVESYINPAMWRALIDTSRAYGLVQFKPVGDNTKFYGWFDTNVAMIENEGKTPNLADRINEVAEKEPSMLIVLQLDYLIESCQPGEGEWLSTDRQYVRKKYQNMPFAEFVVSQDNPYDLALAFHGLYERSGAIEEKEVKERGDNAMAWYEYFNDKGY